MKNTYLRGELYYADLGTGIGSEQNGYRPVEIGRASCRERV